MSTNLNIRTDTEVKNQAEKIFNELGLNLTTAVNMFLRQAIRANGIPFEVVLDKPNEITLNAIEEAKRLAKDKSVKGYHSIKSLKESLEDEI